MEQNSSSGGDRENAGVGTFVLVLAFVVVLAAIFGLVLWSTSGGDAIEDFMVCLVLGLLLLLAGVRRWNHG